MIKKIVVYKITNNITGQIYFGITGQKLAKRWWRHCNNKARPDVYISRCIIKYGKDNFTISEIESFDCYEDAFNAERMLIAKHETNLSKYPNGIGMNLTDGGDGTVGRPIPDYQKKMQSEMMKGKKKTKEHAENIRLAKLGSNNPMFGKKPSEKNRMVNKARWTGEGNPRKGLTRKPRKRESPEAKKLRIDGMKHKVCKLDEQGNVIAVFDSATEADRSMGIGSGVAKVCRGINKLAGGFKWKYFNEIHAVV